MTKGGNPHPSSLGPGLTLTPLGGRVYLDFNATTPPASFLKEKVVEWLDQWGNPSSIHRAGRGPKALLRGARRSLAAGLGCDDLELIFTSGGSEANNLALKGAFFAVRKRRSQILVSAVEHPSVLKAARSLENHGAEVIEIPVLRSGHLDLEFYRRALGSRTALVSVMYANNETGNIFPIQEMARMAKEAGALFHCDAVQALGKADVRLKEWGVDLASFAGHKFYGLKGAGVLYARRGTQLEPLISGGGQERGRRAGTENLLAIAAMGAMSEYLPQAGEANSRLKELRDRFETSLIEAVPGVRITGADAPRLGNTSSLVIDQVDGETLLMNLDMLGFCVSTGAACSSGNPEPSPVLLKMGLSRTEAQSSLRVSLGWSTTRAEIDRFVAVLMTVISRLRGFRRSEQVKWEGT